jgi:putative MATE family efflux protein
MDQQTKSLALELYRMTLPMIVGVLALMSYQLVDSAFIGQLGVKPLAAVGFTIPVYQMIIGIQVGLGIATTSVVSRALGSGDEAKASALGTLVIVTGFMVIALLCLLIWFNQEFILGVLGAKPSIYPTLREYWLPWLLSSWCGAMLYFGYSIYRSHGATKKPGMVMLVSSLLNIAFDPLFIFTFDLGIAGAAWASICAMGCGLLLIYPAILAKGWIELKLPLGSQARANLKQLVTMMVPAMMGQFIPPISAVAATSIVAGFGETVVAGWGLGVRMDSFSIVVILALTMALPPMVGRLRGRGEFATIHRLVVLAVSFVLVWQLVLAWVTMGLSGYIGALLTLDSDASAILEGYLWRIPLSHGALGVCMIVVSVSNAIGLPMRALITSALRLFACYLPALWLGTELMGQEGLFTGAMVGNIAAGIMSWQMYRTTYSKAQQAA